MRKNHVPLPILVVSGNSGIDDKITAFGTGEDGYLTKPFDRYELVANLEAIIRRTHGHSSAKVNVGNLIVDLKFLKGIQNMGQQRLDNYNSKFDSDNA